MGTKLLGYVTTTPCDPAALKAELRDLANSRRWVDSQPVFVNEVDETPLGSGDAPLRTLGAVLDVGQAQMGHEDERGHYEDTVALVEMFRSCSERTGGEVEFELGGRPVGRIVAGRLSVMLQRGLLDEWAKHLPE